MSDIGKGPKSIIKWGNTIREFSHYFGWTFGDFYDSSVVPYSEPQKFSFNATNQASTLAATQNLNSASIQTNTYNTEVTTNNYTLTVDQEID